MDEGVELFIRNEEMLVNSKAHALITFSPGANTESLIARANELDIPIMDGERAHTFLQAAAREIETNGRTLYATYLSAELHLALAEIGAAERVGGEQLTRLDALREQFAHALPEKPVAAEGVTGVLRRLWCGLMWILRRTTTRDK